MRVYSVTEARQKLAEVLDQAKSEDVIIRRGRGENYVLSLQRTKRSPLDVPGVKGHGITTAEIIETIHETRERPWLDGLQFGKAKKSLPKKPRRKSP